MSRRLAAILVADAVGYSRLMGADEVGTFGRLANVRSTIIDPVIAANGGRIFKSMGDGLLIEFASVVEAVNCALTLVERTETSQNDGPLRFRFGLHVGDVIEQDGDLFGDAVNIAARVESKAEPGAVVMTEDAARYVRGKIGRDLEDLGNCRLKNIAEPVRLFRVRHVVDTAAKGPRVKRGSLPNKWVALAGGIAAFGILLVTGSWLSMPDQTGGDTVDRPDTVAQHLGDPFDRRPPFRQRG